MTPRSSWEDIAPLPSWQKYIEEILNKKYGLVAIHEKILPHSHPGRKKIEPKILPTAILAKKYIETIKNKNIFRIYWTKCGPSAMLTKGKVRDEGLDHAKKTKCELNVIH